jgi:anti-sigma regulatory factor (Ser/Thr protein kinase)
VIPRPLPGSVDHLKRQVRRVEPQASERITLSVPGRPEYVVVVRLAAAAIAGRMAFSYDEIEDLKVAVGEVCTAAILEGGPEVNVFFEVERDRLAVEVRHRPDARGRPRREEELDKLLVRVLMDQVATEMDGPERVTRLVKLVTQ